MTETRKAVITGVSGQDGSWLADLLVRKGYEVHGVVRRRARPDFPNIQHLIDSAAIRVHEADLTDQGSLDTIVGEIKPDELYNLAAQSHVGTSFTQPELTVDVTGLGMLRVLEAVRKHSSRTRVYGAGSSEQFGNSITRTRALVANEETPFEPCSPYGAAKVLAHHLARTYREAYKVHVSVGILFNHESERRGPNFVTRKITLGLARMAHGLQSGITLGNIDAIRDWGYAPDYMDAAWRMLQRATPDDYVVATGDPHTVQDFIEAAWLELSNTGLVSGAWREVVKTVPAERRPTDIDWLVGSPRKAKNVLGWEPTVRFRDLVGIMVRNDLVLAQREADSRGIQKKTG